MPEEIFKTMGCSSSRKRVSALTAEKSPCQIRAKALTGMAFGQMNMIGGADDPDRAKAFAKTSIRAFFSRTKRKVLEFRTRRWGQ